MKKTQFFKNQLSFILCMVLIAAMALVTVGCGDNKKAPASSEQTTSAEVKVMGEGKTEFNFTVIDANGKETPFLIRTDKEFVGDALQELDLIAGDEGEFGLYVKTVNGITVDYNTDGAYWAFYVNGEYAASGVDSTKITPGENYSFKVEKA